MYLNNKYVKNLEFLFVGSTLVNINDYDLNYNNFF